MYVGGETPSKDREAHVYLEKYVVRMGGDATGSGSCPMSAFGISGV
jgi:hypothetical protein